MNRVHIHYRGLLTPIIAATVWSFTAISYAGTQDCWADFYQDVQYAGPHIRLDGPTQLSNLTNLQGANWDMRIESLKVGPKAKVIVFENQDFKLTLKEMANHPDLMHALGVTEQQIKEDAEDIFSPNAAVHDLSDFHFTDKIRSLKIDCMK